MEPTQAEQPAEVLRVADVMRRTGLKKPDAILALLKSGRLRGTRTSKRGRWLISAAAFEAWLLGGGAEAQVAAERRPRTTGEPAWAKGVKRTIRG